MGSDVFVRFQCVFVGGDGESVEIYGRLRFIVESFAFVLPSFQLLPLLLLLLQFFLPFFEFV